jgi:hypothetical protein
VKSKPSETGSREKKNLERRFEEERIERARQAERDRIEKENLERRFEEERIERAKFTKLTEENIRQLREAMQLSMQQKH